MPKFNTLARASLVDSCFAELMIKAAKDYEYSLRYLWQGIIFPAISFFKDIMPSNSKKNCTKCLVEKPLSEFYRKENRLDSACKKCKKEARQTTYVASKNIDDVRSLIRLFDVIFDSEVTELKQFNRTCRKVLKKYCQEEAA